MKVFRELRRRNVFRVAAAYVVISWVLVQVADAMFPALNLPAWTNRFVAGILLLGFPVSLLVAWTFELTPEGLRRDSGGKSTTGVGGRVARRLDIATLAGVFVAVLLFAWQELRAPDPAPGSRAADTGRRASIAVLAFENMSPDPENTFFAEGISEEILNVLSAIDSLRVASRTSAFSFARTETPVTEIAARLDVAHVLEGSVRKQGNRVRITAQLIDAETDTHLWSQRFERELDDIFAVQEEIARAIAAELVGTLGIADVNVAVPTRDLEAYELFLRGRQQFFRRGAQALRAAIADLEAAVARDPQFAAAWSYLAASLQTYPGYVPMDESEYNSFQARSVEAAGRALAIDPGQALAVAVVGQAAIHTDKLARLEKLRQATEMAPDDAGLLMWYGDALFLTGAYLDEAVPVLERACRLDPLSGINNGVLGIAYLAAGQRGLGRRHIAQAAELGWNTGYWALTADLHWRGETSAATALLRPGWDSGDSAWTRGGERTWQIHEQVLRDEITGAELDRLLIDEGLEIDYYWRLFYYLILRDEDRVFDTFELIQNEYWFRLVFIPGGRRFMEHPRMLDVAERYGMLPVWQARGYPFGCAPVEDGGRARLHCPNWPE